MKRTVLGLLLAASLSPVATQAGEARQHDGGFFFRLTSGAGYASTKISAAGDELKFSGSNGEFELSPGFVVTKNLALHATLDAWGFWDTKTTFNGIESHDDDIEISLAMIGGGATYYLGDSNTYVTVLVGASQLHNGGRDSGDSGTGVAFVGGVGKEWWVKDSLGIGVMGTAGYHSVPPDKADNGVFDVAEHFKGTSFSIRFSATFN